MGKYALLKPRQWKVKMVSNKFFKPREEIAYRGVWRGRLIWACAATVVEDNDKRTVIFWRAGTPVLRPAGRPTPKALLRNDFELVHAEWVRTDVLSITQPGQAHAVELMWEAGQTKLDCWYIQLQEPLRRTRVGFDTMDQVLDIVIWPDKSRWKWKDEDEFAEAVAIGMYSAEEAAAIRTEGEMAIAQFETNQPPFCEPWEDWRPPEDWETAALPEGWGEVDSSQ